ncbi:MAG: response regulator [Candidatus Latescibacteria bacterium]|nr:response regulator [Candidatus Latescibacterota bacterium]
MDNRHNRTQVNLNDIITETIEFLKPKWRYAPLTKGIHIKIETALGEIPDVLADPDELRQVMINLMVNSIETMPYGGLIVITTAHTDSFVLLSISDTGTGLPEEENNRHKEPFLTIKNHESGNYLRDTYDIINTLGGEFMVESGKNKGTIVTISLPAIEEKTEIAVKTVLAPPDEKPGDILVVDDEVNICNLIHGFLTNEGFDVTVATGGPEALDHLKRRTFSILLTDLNMPVVSGLDLALYTREHHPQTYIILFSGLEAKLQELNNNKNIIDNVLQKPFSFAKLCAIIHDVLGK